MGRVINNYLLIREGLFCPINIKFIDQKKYYAAFKEFDEKRHNYYYGRNKLKGTYQQLL